MFRETKIKDFITETNLLKLREIYDSPALNKKFKEKLKSILVNTKTLSDNTVSFERLCIAQSSNYNEQLEEIKKIQKEKHKTYAKEHGICIDSEEETIANDDESFENRYFFFNNNINI